MPLANVNEPLVLANGLKIDPTDGKIIEEYVQVPSNNEAKRIVTSARKKLSDLPLPPKQMNAVSVVVLYSLIGLEDSEISVATGVGVEEITKLKTSEMFSTVKNHIVETILKNDLEDVRHMFMQSQRKAARTIDNLMSSENEAIQLHAAKDMLDRGGNRPVDVHEHRLMIEGGLQIEYVDKTNKSEIPEIVLENL